MAADNERSRGGADRTMMWFAAAMDIALASNDGGRESTHAVMKILGQLGTHLSPLLKADAQRPVSPAELLIALEPDLDDDERTALLSDDEFRETLECGAELLDRARSANPERNSFYAGSLMAWAARPKSAGGEDDPILLVPMPASSVRAIIDGVRALAYGEVPDIFAAVGGHKGRDAENRYSARQARVRAMLFVRFYMGRNEWGITKAMKFVAKELGVAYSTIKDWPKMLGPIPPRELTLAERAGQLAREESLGGTIVDESPGVRELMHQLEGRAIRSFGEWYQQRFPNRHYSR